MLTLNEKEHLYQIITSVIGDDSSIRAYKNSFTESTVDVVEKMIEADIKCNASMKELLSNLLLAGQTGAKGWLKKILKTQSKHLKKNDIKGAGCLVSVKSRWKKAIIMSAI